jgi:hypothetical protein
VIRIDSRTIEGQDVRVTTAPHKFDLTVKVVLHNRIKVVHWMSENLQVRKKKMRKQNAIACGGKT